LAGCNFGLSFGSLLIQRAIALPFCVEACAFVSPGFEGAKDRHPSNRSFSPAPYAPGARSGEHCLHSPACILLELNGSLCHYLPSTEVITDGFYEYFSARPYARLGAGSD
jgi:hypothetical protein